MRFIGIFILIVIFESIDSPSFCPAYFNCLKGKDTVSFMHFFFFFFIQEIKWIQNEIQEKSDDLSRVLNVTS